MTEVTGRVDMNAFSQKIGLKPNETIEQIQELAKTGFVSKTGSGYGITEKGKHALKAYEPVPLDNHFIFYTGVSQPLGASAGSLKQFYDVAKTVDAASLEFHVGRGDVENWIRTTINDAAFADMIASIKETAMKDEDLRKAILSIMESRYSLQS